MNPVLAEYLGTTAFLSSIAFVGPPLVIAGTIGLACGIGLLALVLRFGEVTD